ncbi:hypothetical protein AAHK20_12520 [Trinickia sp. YCB016]
MVAEARRTGSLDSNLRNHASNDLVALIDTLPSLAAVAFNGGTAAKIGVLALAESRPSLELVKLPSLCGSALCREVERMGGVA